MRTIVWMLVVFILAVVAATGLGRNDGIVTLYWLGWRTDLSLNLFVLLLVLTSLAIYSLVRGLDTLLALPDKARQWRTAQRDRAAQSALREALSFYLAGRFTRSHRAAQRSVDIQADTPDLQPDTEFAALAHLLSAGSLHRLQDRVQRDDHLRRAFDIGRLGRRTRAVEDGARLLAIECAIDDQDAPRALRLLADLPAGVARRTQAQRLKLKAARLSRQPLEALRTARMLAKHQGFSPEAAEGLIRTLVHETLAQARDADQLRALWQQLDPQERNDALVVSRAAIRMAEMGHAAEGRQWLAPCWDRLTDQSTDGVDALARALSRCVEGLEAEWLPRLDRVTTAALRSPALGLAVGLALAERQLWGKARTLLMSAANDRSLDGGRRRQAWVVLARLAEEDQRPEDALKHWKAAAQAEF